MHNVRIGTCGWSYKDWCGVFYPADLPDSEFLAYCADHYPIVEVDSSFYRSPTPSMVAKWRDRTPETFAFSLKVPQTITHEKCLADCEQDRDSFLAAARLLGNKLLCCLLQFGYFNKNRFPDLDSFLARLDPFLAAWPKDVQVAVELRNKHWFTPRLVNLLRRHNAAWALADQAWVPSPWYLVNKTDVVTGPFAYIRLLGDREEVDKLTPTLDHIVIDRSDQILANARAIASLKGRVPVVTFVNNHFAGYSPATIQQLMQALKELENPTGPSADNA
jgi:uncharacterized protein YecE (DUF72 family)